MKLPAITPGPWRDVGLSGLLVVGAGETCQDARGHVIAHIDQDEPHDTANAKAIAAVPRLLEALLKCRNKFLHYEQLHRLKCTAEGDEKADRNREMADECDAALRLAGAME